MENYQSKLFPYAYNILGSVEDAKDVVQDIMLKYVSVPDRRIENTVAYLIKAVINQAISAKLKSKKLINSDVWLPEPLSTESPDVHIQQDEIISYSMMVMLEKLNATERAVFVLKEGFDYSHKEIATIIDSTIENSRQLLSRAKAKVQTGKKEADEEAHDLPAYMHRYIEVIKRGDMQGLEKLLAEDISLMADGGSNVRVVKELTMGKGATIDLLLYVFQTYQQRQRITVSQVNHQPALLFYEGDQLANCQVFDVDQGKILRIFSVVDPAKLGALR